MALLVAIVVVQLVAHRPATLCGVEENACGSAHSRNKSRVCFLCLEGGVDAALGMVGKFGDRIAVWNPKRWRLMIRARRPTDDAVHLGLARYFRINQSDRSNNNTESNGRSESRTTDRRVQLGGIATDSRCPGAPKSPFRCRVNGRPRRLPPCHAWKTRESDSVAAKCTPSIAGVERNRSRRVLINGLPPQREDRKIARSIIEERSPVSPCTELARILDDVGVNSGSISF